MAVVLIFTFAFAKWKANVRMQIRIKTWSSKAREAKDNVKATGEGEAREEDYYYYLLDTTNSRSINNVSDYFLNTMKGMKDIEFKLWFRSLRNKGDFCDINRIRFLIRRFLI